MYEILDRISGPEDVKKLNTKETERLAEEIRSFLIESVSKTGGHLASNLGVVELTLALFRAFSLPEDKFIWDVGHQSYVHKLLTGRRDRFSTLRQLNGLAGFPKRTESVYDAFNTGHSSTSVSAALGLSEANALNGNNAHVVAIIGDGALSGGMALEALCDAGNLKRNFIVILNDNNMSISKSVNGFTKHLTKLRAVPAYLTFKSRLETFLSRGPAGHKFVLFLKKVKDIIKHLLIGKTMFDNMGYTYLGPIDGHDVESLTKMLEHAKKIKGPVLLHCLTVKGKGYKFAEKEPTIYHGVSTFEATKGVSNFHSAPTFSAVFGNSLCELAQENKDLCVVTAAMAAGTGTKKFLEKYPDRFYDVGIAEQHAVTFAAGLAVGGKLPFVAIYSSFLQRAYDQILHDVCLQNLNVVFCIDRAGIVGEDGETHHGLFDLAFLSSMPNMTVLAPADFKELREMLAYAASGKHQGPLAIRYPRGKEKLTIDSSPFVPFRYEIVSEGKELCILSVGTMLKTCIDAEKILLENSIKPTVINLRTVYPICRETILTLSKEYKFIVTLEDGSVTGGIGEHIASVIASENANCNILTKGYPPIVPHGSPDALCTLCKMDAVSLADEILNLMER